jgi:hypothetical protein
MPIPPAGFSGITAGSLLHWLWALVWAGAVFVAIVGYGGLLLRALGIGRPLPVLAGVAGFGIAIFLGGLLNLAHLIYVPVLTGFVATGVALAALLVRFEVRPDKTGEVAAPHTGFARKSLTAKLLLIGIVAVLAIRVASSVHDCQLQESDDFNYYLAAPKKMIQRHTFGADPYSERRAISSIGGNEFVDTLILATQPLESVQMGDWTLGVFLLGLLAFALGNEFELTEIQRYALAFFLLITPQLRFNLTFVVLPSALFLGLVYVVANRELTERYGFAQAVVAGGMVGAVASLKSSYLTHGVIFLVCIGLLRWWKRGFPAGLRFFAIAAASCLVIMLPWMLANHLVMATWFFPILGKGFHYSAYGHYASPTNLAPSILLQKVIPFCVPLLVLFLVEFYWGERDERTMTIAALMLTAFVASIVNGMATGGDSVRRYNYPCILPAITLVYAVFAQRRNAAPNVRRWRLMETGAALIAIVTAVNTGTTKFTSEYKDHWVELHASLTDAHLTTTETRTEYAALQAAIPSDGGVLATLTNPFLLDFGKRDVMIADFPGTASPKPGWPTWESGEAFAQFLLEHNVRYLMYSYGECDPAPYANCDAALDEEQSKTADNPHITRLIRNESGIGYQARHQYEELARTRRHVYDDGKIYILDLTKPAA